MSIRIAAIADLHGILPDIPPCDVLLIAGDIAPDTDRSGSAANVMQQLHWLNTKFKDWLENIDAKEVVAIAGNHDRALHRMKHALYSDLRWHYLCDQGVELFGYRFWGSPWVSDLPGWAFNLEQSMLDQKFDTIPDVDIVLTHMPPFQICDAAWDGCNMREHVGSKTLRSRLNGMQPILSVFGHIHEARGVERIGTTTYVNASVLDSRYAHVHPVWMAYLDQLSTVL